VKKEKKGVTSTSEKKILSKIDGPKMRKPQQRMLSEGITQKKREEPATR
jgi:hypothetical protein